MTNLTARDTMEHGDYLIVPSAVYNELIPIAARELLQIPMIDEEGNEVLTDCTWHKRNEFDNNGHVEKHGYNVVELPPLSDWNGNRSIIKNLRDETLPDTDLSYVLCRNGRECKALINSLD